MSSSVVQGLAGSCRCLEVVYISHVSIPNHTRLLSSKWVLGIGTLLEQFEHLLVHSALGGTRVVDISSNLQEWLSSAGEVDPPLNVIPVSEDIRQVKRRNCLENGVAQVKVHQLCQRWPDTGGVEAETAASDSGK
jgi:hypothetical protein